MPTSDSYLVKLRRHPIATAVGAAITFATPLWHLVGQVSTVSFLVDVGTWIGGPARMHFLAQWGWAFSVPGGLAILFLVLAKFGARTTQAKARFAAPPDLRLEDVFIDHGIRILNRGGPATFSGTVRIVGESASTSDDKNAALWWENAGATSTNLPVGGEDRSRIALKPHVRGFGLHGHRGFGLDHGSYFANRGRADSANRDYWAELEVAITSDPPFQGAPLRLRYHYDQHGLRTAAEAAAGLAGELWHPRVEFSVALLPDHGVVLGVKNLGPTDEFHAQIDAWGHGDTLMPATPATLRWVNGDGRLLEIVSGTTEFLELGRIEHSTGEPPLEDHSGKLRRGVITVGTSWHPLRCLGTFSYWEAEDFRTRLFSLRVVLASVRSRQSISQGVRLHAFGKVADDPTDKQIKIGWGLNAPTLRGSLFDLTQQPPLLPPDPSNDGPL